MSDHFKNMNLPLDSLDIRYIDNLIFLEDLYSNILTCKMMTSLAYFAERTNA